jgi:hypothetical protein
VTRYRLLIVRAVVQPLASTIWLLTFCFVYARILRACLGVSSTEQYDHPLSWRRAAVVFFGTQTLSVPLMVVAVNVMLCGFTQTAPPPPATPMVLVGAFCLCTVAFVTGLPALVNAAGVVPAAVKSSVPPKSSKGLLKAALAVHYGTLWYIALTVDPRLQLSRGVSRPPL